MGEKEKHRDRKRRTERDRERLNVKQRFGISTEERIDKNGKKEGRKERRGGENFIDTFRNNVL